MPKCQFPGCMQPARMRVIHKDDSSTIEVVRPWTGDKSRTVVFDGIIIYDKFCYYHGKKQEGLFKPVTPERSNVLQNSIRWII